MIMEKWSLLLNYKELERLVGKNQQQVLVMHIRMSIHIGVVIRKRGLNAVAKICWKRRLIPYKKAIENEKIFSKGLFLRIKISVFIVLFLNGGLSNKYSANVCGNSHLRNTAYMVYSSHKKGSYSSFSSSSINLLNSVLNSS